MIGMVRDVTKHTVNALQAGEATAGQERTHASMVGLRDRGQKEEGKRRREKEEGERRREKAAPKYKKSVADETRTRAG